MECPIDKSTLVMSERNGIEIDYCPQCRGVWLDRGELDKIIDRASSIQPAPAAPVAPVATPQPGYQQYQAQQPRYDDRRNDQQGGYRKKKRENWLSELFE